MAFGIASEVPSLACVSRRTCPPRASFHGHGRLTFGSLLLYPWLSGYRAGVHTHTTELEALSQSWSPYGGVWNRLGGAFSCLCLTSHMSTSRASSHDHRRLTFGSFTLIPVALRLQGWRIHPYHRAGSPEPVVGVPWWPNVSPYRRDLLAVSWHRVVHVRSALVASWAVS